MGLMSTPDLEENAYRQGLIVGAVLGCLGTVSGVIIGSLL